MRVCPQCKRSFDEHDFRVCPADGTSLIEGASTSTDPMLGRVLAGRFRIVEAIGKGGMGVVYKAVHTEMDRICAIKLLAPVANDTESAARFRREAKMTSRIDSPNAVTIYDFGEAEPRLLYLAMEFIEGESLADVLVRERLLSLERAVNITNQISHGLAAAHSLGIIHRDLKPGNIMLTRRTEHEAVKVLDFGIAKMLTGNNDESITQTGALLGTPTYMSPEQAVGEVVDVRTDIYSLSIMVYQMLSGELPFEGNTIQTQIINRINYEPKPLRRASPSLNEAIEFVVMSGLSRDPAKRPADVQQFAAALSAAAMPGAVSIEELRVLLRKNEERSQSSAARDTTKTVAVLPNRDSSQLSITLMSPPQVDVNVMRPDSVPTRWAAAPQDVPPAPSQGNARRLPLLTVLFVVASVLIVAALLGTVGYYVYLRSTPGTQKPGASAPGQPVTQTSQPNTESNKQPARNGDPGGADSHYAEGKTYQQQARLLASAGSTTEAKSKNEEAVAAYGKAIAIQPNFAEAHENLGVALYDLGKPAEAVSEFEIALGQYGAPTAQVWTNYGLALLVIKQFRKAATALVRQRRSILTMRSFTIIAGSPCTLPEIPAAPAKLLRNT